MLYLVCRADQLPVEVDWSVGPISFRGNTDYYPRLVAASSPQEAIDEAFSPSEYKPGGMRELMVVELGKAYQFQAKPVRHYTLQEVERTRLL